MSFRYSFGLYCLFLSATFSLYCRTVLHFRRETLCRYDTQFRYIVRLHYFVSLYSILTHKTLSTTLSPACAQRDGGLAQRRHSCTTFQIRTSRRRCAKPLVVSSAFNPSCRVISLSTQQGCPLSEQPKFSTLD